MWGGLHHRRVLHGFGLLGGSLRFQFDRWFHLCRTLQDPNILSMKAYIEAQGSLLSLKVTGFKSQPNINQSKRGIIRIFSRSSRLRLMRFMARLKFRKIRATFLTLTFQEMVSHERARMVFKRFAMRLRRAFASVSAVWRLEYQPKRGAIHFHLICFNLPFWEQAEVQRCWEACTQEHRSIVDIRLIHGARSIMAYVSKYIAKIDNEAPTSLDDGSYQHGEGGGAGRFWGWINKELLPLGQKLTGVLLDRHTIRSLSSFMWSLIGSDNPYNSVSAHLFCDNATWLCERAIEESGLYSDEYGWSLCITNHHYDDMEYIASHISPEPHSGDRFEAHPVHARPNEVRLVQPCISGWLQKASRTEVQERQWPYFTEHGTLASIVQDSKGHSDGTV